MKKMLRRIGGIAVLMVIVSMPVAVEAQVPIIPPNDDDISQIIEMTRPYTGLAEECSRFECPDFDCESAQDAFIRLRDARKYMRYMHFWLSRATDTHMDLFQSLADEGRLTSERLAKVQTIVAWQEYITGISKAMLDIASASANLKDLAQNPSKLNDMSASEVIDNLDTFIEGAKDIDSASKAVRTGANAELDTSRNLFSLGSDELDDIKSTLSDLKSIVQEASKDGRNWRAAYKTRAGRASVGAIIGRVASVYADSEIEERKRLIQGWISELNATDFAQSGAFDEFVRIQNRRNKAEDAFDALDKLLVIRSRGTGGKLTRCFLKRKNSCAFLDLNYVSKIIIPEDFQISDIHSSDGPAKHWGEALRYFNAKLPDVERLLEPGPNIDESTKPELQLAQTSFEPGEDIQVNFTAPVCYTSNSWVGIIPSTVSHGSEEVNRERKIGTAHFLLRKRDGEFEFRAPDQEGKYDIRMNDADLRKEVASVSFSVLMNDERSASVTEPTNCQEPGEELGTGTSYVFVVDASDSMNEKKRIDNVKVSARGLVTNMRADDEVALIMFKDCNVTLLTPFTQVKQQFLKNLSDITADGGTALAQGIIEGGEYLLAEAVNEQKSLIVLTDGMESCEGNPEVAAARFREQLTLITPTGFEDADEKVADQETPEVVSIRAFNNQQQPIDELEHGKPFLLEVTFAGDHPDAWTDIDIQGQRNIIELDGTLGDMDSSTDCVIRETRADFPVVIIYRSEDHNIFRSRPLLINAIPDG